MGNATIWYQPNATTTQYKIDLGRKLREREGPTIRYLQSTSESYGGASVTRIYGGRMSCRLMLTWQRTGTDGTDAGSILRRKLFNLEAHLKRGGYCTVAEDATYAWAAFASRPVALQDTTITFHTPVITNTIAAASTPLGRELYLHSDPDIYLTEMTLCSVVSTHYVTLDRRVFENWEPARWVLLREAGFYPAMRVPPQLRGQQFLTHRDERVFYLDLPLEEDPEALEELAQSGSELVDESDAPQGQDFPGADIYADKLPRFTW